MIAIYVRQGLFFSEAKEYSAQYLAYFVAKAGGGLPANYPQRRSSYLPGYSPPA
jgi:hypothetical protein